MYFSLIVFVVSVSLAVTGLVKSGTRNSEGWLIISAVAGLVAMITATLLYQWGVDRSLLWLATGFAVSITLTMMRLSYGGARWREEDNELARWSKSDRHGS